MRTNDKFIFFPLTNDLNSESEIFFFFGMKQKTKHNERSSIRYEKTKKIFKTKPMASSTRNDYEMNCCFLSLDACFFLSHSRKRKLQSFSFNVRSNKNAFINIGRWILFHYGVARFSVFSILSFNSLLVYWSFSHFFGRPSGAFVDLLMEWNRLFRLWLKLKKINNNNTQRETVQCLLCMFRYIVWMSENHCNS